MIEDESMIDITILVGNMLSLGAMISDSISGTKKKRSEMLAVQIVSQFFYGASAIVRRVTAVPRRMLLPYFVTLRP